MRISAILFDLDGTLLPMDLDTFTRAYFGLLAAKLAPYGYEPKTLFGAISAGIAAMSQNDGSAGNETVFWNAFTEIYGKDSKKELPVFEEFYRTDFNKAKDSCGFTPMAKEVITFLHENKIPVILATNPFFPAIATENRVRWAGLCPEDFTWITTYENSSFCKPNPAYYLEILNRFGLKPEECIMIGNDVTEDMVAENLGMKVFLLTDCIINKENKDISVYPNGGFPELLDFLRSNLL